MKVPIRAPEKNVVRGVVAAICIAVAATAVGLLLGVLPGVHTALQLLDDTFYDAYYRARPAVDRTDSQVVMIAIDDKSLDDFDKNKGIGWPWPRASYGFLIQFANEHGAKAVVFDLLFSQTSPWHDDPALAKAADGSKIPVIFASLVNSDGSFERFIPPVTNRILGGANFSQGVARSYASEMFGQPSLAVAALRAIGTPDDPQMHRLFQLHYYGAYQLPGDRHTFRYLSADNVIQAVGNERKKISPLTSGVDPNWFAGKIVLICATSAGTYDLKSTPLSDVAPGTEIHATAIENLLEHREVVPLGWRWTTLEMLLCTILGALGSIVPRKVWVKLSIGVLAVILVLGLPLLLFLQNDIRWLAPAAPLTSTIVAVVGAFAWSYFAEDRSRKLILKALSQYVSPAVAAELNEDPSKLRISGERREMTVMFTDIAGFTDLSEKLQPTDVSNLLNYYLDAMTGILFNSDGTVDKYIGDAIVTFWNAPVSQPDHALRACRAAMAMRKREAEIQDELIKLGQGRRVITRIGINSGAMSVGNMGCNYKFNYTVLGDSVNLGSRLEAINKYYGTNVMISHDTAELVKDAFVMRAIDVIRVKGKKEPLAIYQLLAENPGEPSQRELADQYGTALKAYQTQHWDEADKILLEILARIPDDGPSKTLRGRIEHFRADPPPDDWQGIYDFKEK